MDRREFLTAAATPLVLGVAPPAFARRSGGLPLALVTADLESSIVAVELPSGRVYRRLQTPSDPRSIESIGGTAAIVAHTSSGHVSLIDPSLDGSSRQVRFWVDVVTDGEQPSRLIPGSVATIVVPPAKQ